MLLQGKLIAESPIYRGNARKTLFTRDGDGKERLVSLAGEIAGTAQALMDAFIGRSADGKNIGLLNRLWRRLYGTPMPERLVTQVKCKLQEGCYTRDRFFDLRMGLKLDEDRWAAEANANYKMETVFRHAIFDFSMTVDDKLLREEDNAAKLYYVLRELQEGRFWFGAGKSKGLGRVRLEMDLPFSPSTAPQLIPNVNHLSIALSFNALNPVLVGWNWGKIDPEAPAFAAVEGQILVGAMRDLPDPVRSRLEMALSGPIFSPEDWKHKFSDYLPRTIAVWLQERSSGAVETWVLHSKALAKLSKGKYALSKKVVDAVTPLCDQPFPSLEAAEAALVEALADKANMAGRILKEMEKQVQKRQELDETAWQAVAQALGLDERVKEQVVANLHDEAALTRVLREACRAALPRLYLQIDKHIQLLQSDSWVDAEIAEREAHMQIKMLLLEGKISEQQWNDRHNPPEGISLGAWRSFLDEHSRVRYHHIVQPSNLRKSITNDRNFIAFLESYRARVRQELTQPYHIDFRFGGPSNREVSRKYGKPYDTMFMRMLTWSPSTREEGAWEIYIPGSTIKGAFRRRASQVLKTLWGESPHTDAVLDRLFGTQGQIGAVFFSDAYLADQIDPERSWCSMDGVRMDPRTGRPVEAAKRDYLFAYGKHLLFQMKIDFQDITSDDMEALSILLHLLNDFRNGDIPIGGEKTSGFGWVQANVDNITWLTSSPDDSVTQALFPGHQLVQDGVWHRLVLEDEAAAKGLPITTMLQARQEVKKPLRAPAGFISHRAFGGYCGMLAVEVETLTPTHVRESGEPSFRAEFDGHVINGWDFFSMAPPQANRRPDDRLYALPSRSIKGVLRHIYAIASDSLEPSSNLSNLNPVDSLFGWVGAGQNQALMGRLSVGFGFFEAPALAWFKVAYPYTGWAYNGRWHYTAGQETVKHLIAQTWRLFPHTPLAPPVTQLDVFQPDTVQANYFRAVMPGSKARFTLRFWNLEEEELRRLLWCVVLEPDLAHKIGHHRYLGLGSLRMRLLPESYLIDWGKRYTSEKWQQPLRAEEWVTPKVVAYYTELKKALTVG
ncbi:MAG: RAMP superfamily CRISPR-associated protein [Anaerolineae bacterium]|nr:RAMP superfamily CRISPR-associated protein [Anaerolineae bacterium]